jgi:sugar/nucleoside kinase (ribokinase family)
LNLVIVGSIAFDSIETATESVERTPGGSATYASLAASYFTPCSVVSVVGGDFTPEHGELFSSKGIDIEGVESREGEKTFFWRGRYGEDPNRRETLVTELNCFENFEPILPASCKRCQWLLLGNIDPSVQMDVLRQCDNAPRVACDTMNFWIEGKLAELRELMSEIDILIINDDEARMLSGDGNLVKAAEKVIEMGPRVVVIKKGEHGAFLAADDFKFFAPAYPLADVVDPTGAGDSFAGGLMGYLASQGEFSGNNLRRGMIYGTIMASFACQHFSVRGLVDLTRERIERRFQELVGMVSIIPG